MRELLRHLRAAISSASTFEAAVAVIEANAARFVAVDCPAMVIFVTAPLPTEGPRAPLELLPVVRGDMLRYDNFVSSLACMAIAREMPNLILGAVLLGRVDDSRADLRQALDGFAFVVSPRIGPARGWSSAVEANGLSQIRQPFATTPEPIIFTEPAPKRRAK